MKILKLVAAALALSVFLAGCSSSALSKGKARDLIESSNEFQEHSAMVPLTPDDLDEGLRAGYWTEKDTMSTVSISLTAKGSQFFSHIGNQYERFPLTTAKPLKPFVADVTSISTSQNGGPDNAGPVTTVQFKWDYKWQGFPSDLVAMFRKSYPASAQANFRYVGGQWKLLGTPVPVRQGLIP
jgi:hypothetical protein